MLNYTNEQIQDIIKLIIEVENFIAIPIGNHELKRNLVYNIKMDNNKSTILKFYFKQNKINREIAALKLLSNSQVKCAKIIKYGSLYGIEWALFDYINGQTFEKIQENISFENQLKIFESMGEELGKIHDFAIFDFFGDWDKDGNSIDNIKDSFESFVSITECYIEKILIQEHSEKSLLMEAINKIRDNYTIIKKEYKESRLRHNDFDGRNILIDSFENNWRLSGVVDFEQSTPGDIYTDIVGLYHKYFLENKCLEDAFFEGYNKYFKLDKNFNDKLKFYLLRRGLGICSWAFKQAPEYYQEGIKLVEMFIDFDI